MKIKLIWIGKTNQSYLNEGISIYIDIYFVSERTNAFTFTMFPDGTLDSRHGFLLMS